MAELKYDKKTGRLLFTKQMKREYTILMPNMAPIHFKILEKVFNYYGYKYIVFAVPKQTEGEQDHDRSSTD